MNIVLISRIISFFNILDIVSLFSLTLHNVYEKCGLISDRESGHLNFHATGNLLEIIRAQGDARGICTSRWIYSVILIK